MSFHSSQPQDRRMRRSSTLPSALHYQLLHASELFEIDLLTISDADGHLIATSTESPMGTLVSEVTAAFSPIMSHEAQQEPAEQTANTRLLRELQLLGLDWDVESISCTEFHVGGSRMFLTAVGNHTNAMREIGIYRVIFGVRRIWNDAI
ncbi:MAG: hypothetical protein AAFS10_00845 [Myxococcota bacterium]